MAQPAHRSFVVLLVAALAFVVACSSEEPAPVPTPVREPGTTPDGLAVELDRLAKDLASHNEARSAEAIDALEARGPRALPAVISVLEHGDANARENALEVATALALPETVPALVTVLGKEDDRDVRYKTTILLGQLADPRGREVIEATLRDPDWGVRTGAARACATLCTSPESIDRLVTMAISDQPVQAGIWARSTLVKMLQKKPADPAAPDLPALVRAAIERDARPAASGNGWLETRVRGALLLSDIGDPSGMPALRDAATEQSLDMLLMPYALYTLGQIGDASAVPGLTRALDYPRPEVSAFAYDALRRLAAKNEKGAAEAVAGFKGQKPDKELRSPLP
jgi:HEAT repeat protein